MRRIQAKQERAPTRRQSENIADRKACPLLICDANVLIDLDIGGLFPVALHRFRLGVPDLLYFEELEKQHRHLRQGGLEIRNLDATGIARILELVEQHPRPSRNDLSALALAEAEGCPLLTGDQALKMASMTEKIEVHGTLWLVDELTACGALEAASAEPAYEQMRRAGRWLPWKEVQSQLEKLSRTEHEARVARTSALI